MEEINRNERTIEVEKQGEFIPLSNEYLQVILGAKCTDYNDHDFSLKETINVYYDSYKKFCENFDQLTKLLLENLKGMLCSNLLYEKIFQDMRIENIKFIENVTWERNPNWVFEVVNDGLVPFRLQFGYNSDCPSYGIYLLKEQGDMEIDEESLKTAKALEKSINYGIFENRKYLPNILENILKYSTIIDKSYSFKSTNPSFPYMLLIDKEKIVLAEVIEDANDVVPLVNINLENETMNFSESFAKSEFDFISKEYFLTILRKIRFSYGEVEESLDAPDHSDMFINSLYDFVKKLLIKYDVVENKEEPIEELSGSAVYYLNVGNDEYKLISGYKKVEKILEDGICYLFEFEDGSMIKYPRSSVLEIKSENKPVCDSGAYASFKKLTLAPKEGQL